MPNRVLFVDDEPEMRDLVAEALGARGIDVDVAKSAADALVRVEEAQFDAVVTDVNLEGTSGLDLCRRIGMLRPDLPVVVITAFGSLETAVGAIRAGACDFITKPVDMQQLALALGRAIQLRALQNHVKRLVDRTSASRTFGDIIGESPPMERLFDFLGRVATSDATVLVSGESGTGKELVASALHERSHRRTGPFVAINCAALPEGLLESELFGHVRGAFTDAKLGKTGLLVSASGGTLLLDEIGEMSPSTQVKLLRALQERTVRPIGGEREIPFDVRIVAATNRDLEAEVAEHRFREDLYYRVNVVRIDVPPLRARGNDVLILAQAFVERFGKRSSRAVRGISRQAAEKLLAYDWPGNVRELQNCIERAVALTRSEELGVEDLPVKILRHGVSSVVPAAEDQVELLSLDELARRHVLSVLRVMNGNKSLTAQVLGVNRRTLYRRLESYG